MASARAIDRWGASAPDRLAHVSDDRVLTFGELLARSDALAAWLDANLGDNRAPIAVLGHKEPEMLIAFLGAVKCGRPYVPIDLLDSRAARRSGSCQTPAPRSTLTPARVAEIVASIATAPPRRVGRRRSLLHPLHLAAAPASRRAWSSRSRISRIRRRGCSPSSTSCPARRHSSIRRRSPSTSR